MPISRKLRITAIAAAGTVVAIVVGLWLGVPAAARWGIETVGAREIGRTLKVGDVRFNPFTLKATLTDLSVAGLPDEKAPLLTIGTIEANVSIASVRHLAPVIEALRASAIRANVVRLAENRFNFSDIVDRLMAKPASPEPARFALYNLEIDDAAIAFDDRVQKSKHMLDAIRLGLPFISSLPDDVQIKVRPSFSARLDGDPIALAAESQPFESALDTSVALKLQGIELPRYLGYVPLRLKFDLRKGLLDTDLRIHFRRAAAATAEQPARDAQLSLAGSVAVRDLALAERGGEPLLSWRRLDVALDGVEVLNGRARLRSIALDGIQARIVRRADGSIAGAAMLAEPIEQPAAEKTATEGKAATGKPFAFEVSEVKVSDGAVDFVDEGARFTRRVAPIAVELKGLANRPDAVAKLSASLATDDGARVDVSGDVGIAPLKLALSGELAALPLKDLQPYLRAFTTARVEGNLDAGARLWVEQSEPGISLKVEDARVEVGALRVRDGAGGKAALDLTRLALAGGAVDAAQRTVTLGQIKVDGLRVIVSRRADGSLDWARQMVEQKAAPDPSTAAAPWQLRLGELQVNGARIEALDEAVEPAARLAASNIDLQLRDVSSDGRERSALTLRARTGGGTIGTRGWVRIAPLAANLNVDVRNVDVGALRPYIKQFANALLTSASVWAKGKLALDTRKDPTRGEALQAAYDGSARVTNLALLDGGGENDLLRWQVLNIDTVKLRTGAEVPEIDLSTVQLSDFYARAILSPEGRLNLVDVFSPPEAQADTTAATSPAPPAAPPPADNAAPPRPVIRIAGIELVRGNVNFTDNFVKPNYTANLTDLGGTVAALASDTANPADVSIRGRVDSDAPVEITGKLNPLAPKLYLDIAASAQGVELPRLTPYSVKYAGYPITKGKLSMDVHYSVENDQLKADNHLFLDQLTFGERVDSPTATKLPVLFAVSLLKNTRGEIDINLPISGSLNDPQFSLGGIIVRVIVNLLTKAVTAPFSLLAAAFGGGEELGYLEFPAGSAALEAAQTKKLATLAKALADRPALRLEITGRVDPTIDTEPLRASRLEAKLRAAKLRELVRAGESVDPATVKFAAEERPALVARVYGEEKIPNKPRNVLGIAKTIPTAEMEKLILATIPVAEADLRGLANERAAAARDRLEAEGKIARDRVFLVAPKLTAEGIKDQGRPSRVDFSLK